MSAVRVVVTGAAGFIGAACAHGLLDSNVDVVGIDRLDDQPAGRLHRAWRSLTARAGFIPLVVDLNGDSIDLADVFDGADAVIHLAGRGGTHESWSDYGAYLRDNVEATARVARACVIAGSPRLVHASSSSVYGREAIGDEMQLLRPVSPYGVSKLAAEQTVEAYLRSQGLRAVIVRMFSVYGPGQRPDMGVYRLISASLWGTPFQRHGDGTQSRSMTFVDDLVAGLLPALVQGVDGAVYNLGGASGVSLNEVVDEVSRQVGQPLCPSATDDPPGNQRHTAADISRASLELGYAPKVGLTEGLARQIAWQRSLGGPSSTTRAAAG